MSDESNTRQGPLERPVRLGRHKFHAYRGKCRNCSHVEDWCVSKDMAWVRFYSTVRENNYPCFMNRCENCGEMAVYDLVAVSPEFESEA